jgi:uncharacterized protein (DUF427 family)
VSLTLGNGPLARNDRAADTTATIDGPGHLLWFQEVPSRIRIRFAGETIADTTRAKLLHETRLLPVYYLPRDDVRFDLLEPTDHTTHCPFKGDARYWTLRVGDRVSENVAWGYDEPVDGAPDLAPYVAFYFDRVGSWYEEDERLMGHPRDPFHRIDVRRSSRRAVVKVDGRVVAESVEPRLLFETGLPTRVYLPPYAWDSSALTRSDRTTVCAYKGVATYHGVRAGDDEVPDLVWRYQHPQHDAEPVTGMICAPQEHERVEVTLDDDAL